MEEEGEGEGERRGWKEKKSEDASLVCLQTCLTLSFSLLTFPSPLTEEEEEEEVE